jgi:hypothetical protein
MNIDEKSCWILLRMRTVWDQSEEKIKAQTLCSKTFFRKSCRVWDNVEEYGTAGHATYDNIIRRMRTACWITNVTDTHSRICNSCCFFHRKSGYAKVPNCYVMRTLPLLFIPACFPALSVAQLTQDTVKCYSQPYWSIMKTKGRVKR